VFPLFLLLFLLTGFYFFLFGVGCFSFFPLPPPFLRQIFFVFFFHSERTKKEEKREDRAPFFSSSPLNRVIASVPKEGCENPPLFFPPLLPPQRSHRLPWKAPHPPPFSLPPTPPRLSSPSLVLPFRFFFPPPLGGFRRCAEIAAFGFSFFPLLLPPPLDPPPPPPPSKRA